VRFKPHIIQADEAPLDEDGELLLPDDLASLGGQLSAESSQLAACYPPADEREATTGAAPAARLAGTLPGDPKTSRKKGPPQGTHWRRRLALWSAGLVSLALLLALVTAHLLGPEDDSDRQDGTPGELASAIRRETAHRRTTSPRRAVGEVPSGPMNAVEQDPAQEDTEAAIDHGELSPIMFLQEVSAPELEGWYDLNEQRDSDDADLSI
jgi:hypothetical protein